MPRALVIRTAGDPEMAQAMATAIMPKQPTAQEYEAIKAELKAMKEREAALGVRVMRDHDYFYCKAKEAEYYYGDNPKPSKPAAIALGVIGLICEVVDRSYKYLSAWNRQA